MKKPVEMFTLNVPTYDGFESNSGSNYGSSNVSPRSSTEEMNEDFNSSK